MRSARVFGLRLVFALVLGFAAFLAAHMVRGQPGFGLFQNLLVAVAVVCSLMALAERERLHRGLWRLGAGAAFLLPPAIALAEAGARGTRWALAYAAVVLAFALLGHGTGAMGREEPAAVEIEDLLPRLLACVGACAVAGGAMRLLTTAAAGTAFMAYVAQVGAVVGVLTAVLAPAVSPERRGRLMLHGFAAPALFVLLLALLKTDPEVTWTPLALWSTVAFVQAHAEARWRPRRAAARTASA